MNWTYKRLTQHTFRDPESDRQKHSFIKIAMGGSEKSRCISKVRS